MLQSSETLKKFSKLSLIVYNPELGVDKQSEEYFVYLHAEMILNTYKQRPIEKIIPTKSGARQNNSCTIF